MSKIGTWSTTPGSNDLTPPDGWPEGQAPSTVNNCAREMMAQIRTYVNDAQYIDLNNTPSFLTTTTFSMATADATNFHIGRRLKLFDATTLYGTVNSISATFVSVRLDSGVLTTSLSSVALAVSTNTNPSLPEHIYRRKNVITNGQFDIWQRSASFKLSASSGLMYTADRFAFEISSTVQLVVSRSERSANASNVPTLAQCGVFLNNSLLVSISAIDAVVAAGEFIMLETRIEGFDWRQIAHKPTMLSFWVKTDTTGTYCIAVRNSGSNRSYVQEYSVSAADTWEKKTFLIPEAPTAGTWDYSSGIGLAVSWALMAGTTYQGGAGNWTAANILATANQTNLALSAGQIWSIAGIQLEEGAVATPLEIRPYHQERQACKRYYQQITSGNDRYFGFTISTSEGLYGVELSPEMRAAPTVTFPALTLFAMTDGGAVAKSISAATTLAIGTKKVTFDLKSVGTPLTAGDGSFFLLSAAATVALDSEL